jgi:peptide chain release factor subunit 1
MITQEQVDRILRLDGNGLPCVSLYVPAAPGRTGRRTVVTQVASLLDGIRPLAEDKSLEHVARLSLREDIATIEKSIEEEPHRAGAVAVFSCSGQGFYEQLWLPRSTHERAVVDADPYVRPMLGVLDEYERTCVAIVDKADGRIWEHFIDEAQELKAVRDRGLRKVSHATGLTEHRVRNKADELSKKHYRRLVGELRQLFGNGGFDLLVVGGHAFEVPAFVEFLPRELRERLAGSFTVDRGTASPEDIKQMVQGIVTEHAHQKQRRLAGDILEAKAARRPSAVGLDETLWAGSLAAVGSLAVDEEAAAPGVVCDRDGLLARSGTACPLCGGPLREVPDILDELAETVIDDGGDVRHIEPETELRPHQAGALLRFEPPPYPGTGH